MPQDIYCHLCKRVMEKWRCVNDAGETLEFWRCSNCGRRRPLKPARIKMEPEEYKAEIEK